MLGANNTVLLIPSYNANDDLVLSLESISTVDNIDVLIIDDGSDIPPVLETLKNSFNANGQIHLILLKNNVGITKALNIGLDWIYQYNYKYIARLDAGDFVVGERFSLQTEFLETHKDTGLVGSWVDFINEQGDFLFTLKHPSEDEQIRKAMFRYNPFVHPAVMFTADAIKKAGNYSEDYPALEDWACFMEMTKHTKVYNIEKVLLRYTISENSISTKKRFTQSKSKIKLLTKNYSLSWNKTIGLIKSLMILLLPRSVLTVIKQKVFN